MELLDLDAKSVPMAAKSVRIAQVNTVDFTRKVFDRQSELKLLWLQKMQQRL